MAESIELQIKSDAQQATKAIGNLQSKLQGLGSTLNSLNGASISNFASGMSQLATSLRSVSSIDTRTFSKIATNMEKLGNLDTARLVSSASALKSMATELSGFANISKQSAEITQLTASISKLGSKSAGYAADNIRNLGSALKEVMTTLSSAPRVSNNIIQMTNALANLSQQGSKVGSASRSLVTGFSNTTKSIKRTRSGFRGLASTIGKFYATYWLVMRAVGKLGGAVDLASQLTEVQNVVDTTFGNMASKVDDFTKTSIQDFGMSELTVKQISSRFQALGTSIGITSQQVANGTAVANKALMSQNNTLYKTTESMADMSLNLTRLAGDMASFYNVDQADVAKSLQSIFTGTIAPLRRYGLDLTQATLSEWAMKNGLDANIKSMTQAEKVLLRYNYVMANTQAAQQDFSRTANTWANSVRVLKQEFQAWGGIIGSVVINALKPFVQALSKVMLKVISFTRTVADALGAIFGWTIEISGGGATADDMEGIADGVGDIGDNANSSNKKAQKLKKTLLSIDEIHALDDNSDSGSGGGSGSGGSGGGAGSGVNSSLKKTDGLLEKYKSSIKDLYSLGKYIGDTIADSLNSINWDNVYQSASNFGKGLADFLNGLISPKLFTALGKTIAGSIRTAIISAFSFTSTFDWGNLGDSFASFINGALHEMSRVSDVTGLTGWQELGKTVNNIVHGIRDTLIHTLINIDWKDAFKGISEFIGELDIDTFTILIGAFTWKHGLKEITKTLITSEWKKYATAKGLSKTELVLRGVEVLVIVSGINYVLAHMKGWIDKLKEWFKSPESGLGITNEATGFDGKKIKLVTPLDWRIKEIKWKIKDAEKSVDNFFKDLGNYFKKGWKTFKKNMSLNVDDLQNVLGPQLYNGFVGVINDIIGLLNKIPGVEIPKFKKKTVKGIDDTAKEVGKSASKIDNSYKNLSAGVSGYLGNINTSLDGTKGKMDSMSSKASGTSLSTSNSFSTLSSNLYNSLSGVNGSLGSTKSNMGLFQNAAENMRNGTSGAFSGLANNASTYLSLTGNSFNGLKGNIDGTNGSMGTFSSYAGQAYKINVTSSGIDTVKSKVDNLATSLSSLFNNASKQNWKMKIGSSDIQASFKYGGSTLLDRAPHFAGGGFPEEGPFYMNRGEIVGKFSNGKTAVANNQQITEGIKQAVMEGMAQVMMNSNTGGNSAPVIENVFKCDSETLYRMTQVGKQKYNQRYIVASEF